MIYSHRFHRLSWTLLLIQKTNYLKEFWSNLPLIEPCNESSWFCSKMPNVDLFKQCIDYTMLADGLSCTYEGNQWLKSTCMVQCCALAFMNLTMYNQPPKKVIVLSAFITLVVLSSCLLQELNKFDQYLAVAPTLNSKVSHALASHKARRSLVASRGPMSNTLWCKSASNSDNPVVNSVLPHYVRSYHAKFW